MTPEEQKAKALYDQYYELLEKEMTPINDVDCGYQAKQCALVDCENTIIELRDVWSKYNDDKVLKVPNPIFGQMLFYQKVKEAITKLK